MDSRRKGMSQERCNFDICVTCIADFIDKGLEGEIVAISSDDQSD